MSIQLSTIEWTDLTSNPIRAKRADGSNRVDGHHCEKISPECALCYAGNRWQPRFGMPRFGGVTKEQPVFNADGTVTVRGGELIVYLDTDVIRKLLRSKKIAGKKVFICDMTDMFGRWVPDAWLDQLFALFAIRKDVIWQVLTKRPERMARYFDAFIHPEDGCAYDPRWDEFAHVGGGKVTDGDDALWDKLTEFTGWPLENVWLGTSVGAQPQADERREPLRKLAAAGWLTWVSYEPAIGPVDWGSGRSSGRSSANQSAAATATAAATAAATADWSFLRWLVSGGETDNSRKARPSHPDWHRAARDFCVANGIGYFFKQWGDWVPFATQARYAAGSLMPGNDEVIGGDCGGPGCLTHADFYDPRNRLVRVPEGKVFAKWDDGRTAMADYRNEPEHRWGKENRQTMTYVNIGKKAAGRILDGRTWDEMPSPAREAVRA